MSALSAAVRDRVMTEAARKRPPAERTAPHAQVYAHAVAALDALLGDLSPEEWTTPVIHDWDVHLTVAHLLAGDGALCSAAGVPEAHPYDAAQDWDARSRAVLARHTGKPHRETRDAWRDQARALLAAPAAHEPCDTRLSYAGAPMTLTDAYLARGFETWLHGDDIGRAVGRAVPEPLPETMPTLVALGLVMLRQVPGPPPVRVTLTGPGAAVTQYGAAPPHAELTMTASDFCRLLGGNRRADEITVEAQGDDGTVSEALEMIASMAIL